MKSLVGNKQVVKCEHCGNKSPHEIVFSGDGPGELVTFSSGEKYPATDHYYLARCGSCDELSLFTDWDLSDHEGDLSEAAILYPYVKNIDKIVPDSISKDYDEARKVIKQSPIAFALLARRVLERICDDKGAKGVSLKKKLDNLARQDIVPKSLSEMANAVRYLGNVSAHPGGKTEDVTSKEATILNEFVMAIIEYVYVAPARLKALEERIKGKSKS